MTRINVVPPSELCDEHLRAEYRELTRIPNGIAKGKFKDMSQIPPKYVLGKGHCYFFVNKLHWLFARYLWLQKEMNKRGFKAEDRWPKELNGKQYSHLWGMYLENKEALELNRERIKERWPKNAHYYSEKVINDE